MSQIFVKPTAEYLKVPLTRDLQVNGRIFLKAEGEVVEDGVYWRRREREKDVTIGPVPVAAPTPVPVAAPVAQPAAEAATSAPVEESGTAAEQEEAPASADDADGEGDAADVAGSDER